MGFGMAAAAAKRSAICFIITFSEIPIQQCPCPRTVGDRAFVGRLGEREEVVEPVDGVVEEVVVGLADPDVELALELGAEFGPVRFQNAAKVVCLPVLGGLVVDRAGDGIPERNGPAVGTSGPVGGVPGAPLAAREGPRVAPAEHIFDLALVPHGVANLARDVARRRPLEAVLG